MPTFQASSFPRFYRTERRSRRAALPALLVATGLFMGAALMPKPACAAAPTLTIAMQLEIEGRPAMHSSAIVQLGQSASITQKTEGQTGYKIVVVPTRGATGAQVKMAFEVFELQGATEKLLSSPRILTVVGDKARVEQKGENGNSFALTVTPTYN